ncbi:hypothetical protein [Terricaulis sp.]|uniref:hypothetical protein n=1 Tax=Terricaulis sp. TaxID=2768686 RepID=UPI0037836846
MKSFSFPALVAAALLLSAAALPAPRAEAQQPQQHAENCTTWGFILDINYEYGVVNTCMYPVDVWFLSGSGTRAQGQAAPGGVFSTGIPMGSTEVRDWAAASCRAGYHPNLAVTAANFEAISASQYSCVRN